MRSNVIRVFIAATDWSGRYGEFQRVLGILRTRQSLWITSARITRSKIFYSSSFFYFLYPNKSLNHEYQFIVQGLCESRGGRPGLAVLTSFLVSVDVKQYCTVIRHWSRLVPNNDVNRQSAQLVHNCTVCVCACVRACVCVCVCVQ